MNEQIQTVLAKMRFLIAPVYVLVALLFVSIPISMLDPIKIQPVTAASARASVSDSPNLVTSGVLAGGEVLKATGRSIGVVASEVANGLIHTSQVFVHGAYVAATTMGRGVVASAQFVGKTVGSGVSAGSRALASSAQFVTRSPSSVVASVIRPASYTAMPVIEPIMVAQVTNSAVAGAAAVVTADNLAQAGADDTPAWPMHGSVTTRFGERGWPYATYHMGIDISDNQRSGITPVHPFRPGKVVGVVALGSGLGNHVTIDHGGGITSVYGHLYSMSVSVGQQVTKSTVLGLEGSTGVSTGTHLHFEIHVNGQPVDPRLIVPGQP